MNSILTCKRLTPLIVLLLFSVATDAGGQVTIVDGINRSGNIVVVQPALLNNRLLVNVSPATHVEGGEVSDPRFRYRSGYRVQIFDDNNVRTAKHDAQRHKQMVEEQFPGLSTYVTFSSPYWRVKVGDYKSKSEAEAALAEIKKAFPSLAKSLRIVRERIVESY